MSKTKRWIGLAAAHAALVLWVVACGGNDGRGICTPGDLGCACIEGESCAQGLSCLSEICVDFRDGGGGGDGGARDAAATDGGGSDAGGDGGAGDGSPGDDPSDPAIDGVTTSVEGVAVTLEAMVSDPDEDLEALQIAWGDGETSTLDATSATLTASHSYASLGSYEIELTLTDATGRDDATTRMVELVVPRDGLELELLFSMSADDTSPAARDVRYDIPVYVSDRHGLGERAADLHNGNMADALGLASVGFMPELTLSFSIAIWIHASTGSSDIRIAGQEHWFNLYFPSTDTVAFTQLDGLYHRPGAPLLETPFESDTWTHFVGVVEQLGADTQLALYKDGELVEEMLLENTAYPNPGIGNGDACDATCMQHRCRLYVGRVANTMCTGGEADDLLGFPGAVDDVRIYSRALSAPEVRALFVEGQ